MKAALYSFLFYFFKELLLYYSFSFYNVILVPCSCFLTSLNLTDRKKKNIRSISCIHFHAFRQFTGSTAGRKEVVIFFCITLQILQTSKFLPMKRRRSALLSKPTVQNANARVYPLFVRVLPFLLSPFPFPLLVLLLLFQTGCSFTQALGAGGQHAYRSTLSAEGKGMWATPILWAVSKQPLCNLWLGEVVRGEGAVCLLSVGLHKCVFQIRVGGHVWLHGHNDFPHRSTFGRRRLAFLYSVPRYAKSKHLSSPECFIPDFLSCSACLAIASL